MESDTAAGMGKRLGQHHFEADSGPGGGVPKPGDSSRGPNGTGSRGSASAGLFTPGQQPRSHGPAP